jgi:hypothetical protein
MEQLIKNMVIMEVEAPVAAANNTDNNSDIIDMKGYDGVVFIVPITDSVALGVATLTIEGNTANSDSGMAALTGASATVTSAVNDDLNGQLLIVDVYHPIKRYLQGVETSATQNIAFGNMIAIKYHGRAFPITEDTTVSDSAAVVGV